MEAITIERLLCFILVMKFSVPIHELDAIMPTGWSLNTFHDLSVAAGQTCRDCSLRAQKKCFFIIQDVCTVKAGMEPQLLVKMWCGR